MAMSPLDFVLLQFGSPGYYQVFLGFLLCCLQLPITLTEYLFKFYVYEPPHRCQLSSRAARLQGLTVHKNEWYPVVTNTQRPHHWNTPTTEVTEIGGLLLAHNGTNSSHQPLYDQCSIYNDPVHHWKGTQQCFNGWEFWTPNGEQNLVTEFNLVCSNKYLVTILVHAVALVAFLGAMLFGLVADKWGRTKVLHLTLYLFVASSLSAFFSADFIQFSVFYLLQILFLNVSMSA